MIPTTRRRGVAAALLATALLLAACGDDGGSSADTTAAAEAGSPTTAGGDDAAPESGSATTAGDDAAPEGDFSGEGGDEFCAKLQELEESPVLNGEPDLTDPGALREQYEAIDDAFGELADRAPDEIRDDIETMQRGVGEIIAVFEEYDYDFEQIVAAAQEDPDVAARLEGMSAGDMEAASERLTAYGEQVCGLETGTTTG